MHKWRQPVPVRVPLPPLPFSDITMLVSTLISTFIAGALLCTAAPTPDADAVDASSSIKYGWWIIHWPAADHRVDFHLGRGGAHHKVAIPPGKHPYV